MGTTLWAGARFGKELRTGDYVNHVVIERATEPPLLLPDPWAHWIAQTSNGRWQVGFTLADPVRLAEPCRPGPVAFLGDVVRHLESIYEGERVMRYLNPDHPNNTVQTLSQEPAALRELARSLARSKGGQSRSEAKLNAARENIAPVNRARADAGDDRVKRYQHLHAGGLTLAEIARRDVVTVNAVKCALARARRATNTVLAEQARAGAEWQARLDQRSRFSGWALDQIDQVGQAVTELPDGTVRIDYYEDLGGGYALVSPDAGHSGDVNDDLEKLLEAL